MKAHIPPKLSKQQQDALDKEIKRQCVEINAQYERDYETVIIWTLYNILELEKDEILEFYKAMVSERQRMKEWYKSDINPDDGIDLFAMRFKLKENGIDVDEIINEIKYDTVHNISEEN